MKKITVSWGAQQSVTDDAIDAMRKIAQLRSSHAGLSITVEIVHESGTVEILSL